MDNLKEMELKMIEFQLNEKIFEINKRINNDESIIELKIRLKDDYNKMLTIGLIDNHLMCILLDMETSETRDYVIKKDTLATLSYDDIPSVILNILTEFDEPA